MKNIVIALLLFYLLSDTAYGADQHAVALKYYAKGDYKSAVQLLEAHVRHDPFDWNAHFYLANSYSKLGLRSDAIAHYRLILTNSPNSEVAKSSKLALSTLEKTIRAQHAVQVEAVRKASAAKPPVPVPEELTHNGEGHARADAQLQQQADERKAIAEREKQVVQEHYREERDRVNKEAKGDVRSVPRSFGCGYKRVTNQEYDSTVSSIRREASAKIDRINEHERREIDNLSSRANESRESGNAVYSQLHSKKGGGKINPVGTNLYIRNYQKTKGAAR